MTKLLDPYGRTIDYLRISITDRCNLDCLYCTPLGGRRRLSHEEILSYFQKMKRTSKNHSGKVHRQKNWKIFSDLLLRVNLEDII